MRNMKNLSKRMLALILTLLMCTSMLNLTVFAAEAEPSYDCGLEEHTHTDECRGEPVLICDLDESEAGEPSEGHTHGADCYETRTAEAEESVLICDLEETEAVEGSEGHTHGDGCYTVSETEELTCGETESEGHAHDDGCYTTNEVLACTDESEEHEHDSSCFSVEEVLTCSETESEGHTHGDGCYTVTETKELTCELEESEAVEASEGHTHGVDCYETRTAETEESVLVCELEESETVEASEGHAHTAACYEGETSLVCGKEEHTHTIECSNAAMDFVSGVAGLMEKAGELMDQEDWGEEEYAEVVDFAKKIDALYGEIPAGLLSDESVAEAKAMIDMVMEAFRTATAEETGGIYCDHEGKAKFHLDANVGTDRLFARSDGDHTIYLTDGYVWNGALEFGGNGTVTIQGNGTIDATGLNRSAITVKDGATVILCDGVTITGGTGTDHLDADTKATYKVGGGVYVEAGATFIMNGGSITGNSAAAGGGIYVDRRYHPKEGNTPAYYEGGHLYIYGGEISNNTANGTCRTVNGKAAASDYGGGGIFISGTAVIDPTYLGKDITISNNASWATRDLGGGGIYVNSNSGDLTLINAVITSNHAAGLGGGLASCVHGKVLVNVEGTAIYNNDGKNSIDGLLSIYGTDTDGHKAWKGSVAPGDFAEFAQDLLCAGRAGSSDAMGVSGTVISNTRFDDQQHNWEGYTSDTKDGPFTKISAEGKNNGVVHGGYILGLTAQNKTPAVAAGRNTVTISDNTSASHGGGIACNGKLTLGATTTAQTIKDFSGELTLNVSKTLKYGAQNGTLSGGDFEFVLLDKDWKEIDRASNDAGGNVTLSYAKGIDTKNPEAGTYTFYVKEAAGSLPVAYDSNVYQVAVNVVRTSQNTTPNNLFIHVTKENYTVESVTFTKGTGEGADWAKTDTESTESPAFENTWKMGSLEITKKVNNEKANTDDMFDFTVKLTAPKSQNPNWKDVEVIGAESMSGNGTGTISFKLKADGKATITGIPADSTYTILEGATGYTSPTTGLTGIIEADGENGAIAEANKITVTNTLNTVKLELTKQVTSNSVSSDPFTETKEFAFDVTLTYPNGTKSESIPVIVEVTGEQASTMTIAEDVPVGTTFSISEIAPGNDFTGVTYTYGTDTAQKAYGEAYTGTIAETATGTITVKAENRYFASKTTSLTVEKTWDTTASGYKAGYLPESVTVELVGAPDTWTGEAEATLTKGADGKWTHTWTNLPMYNSEGVAYTYSVKETGINYPDVTNGYKADEASGSLIRVRNSANQTADGVSEIVGGWLVDNGSEVKAENGVMTASKIVVKNTWLGKEDAVKASITIHKVDRDAPTIDIPGVWFTLTGPDGKTQTLPTGADGRVTFTGLTAGTYTLTENAPHTGYLAAGRIWTIQVDIGNKLQSVTELTPDGKKPVGTNTWNPAFKLDVETGWDTVDGDLSGVLTITNQVIRADLSITKALDLDGVTEGFVGEPADKVFEFTVYADTVFGIAKDTVVGTLSLKQGETGTLENLRYGTYRIAETGDTGLTGYTFTGVTGDGNLSEWLVGVTEDDVAVSFTATNHYERDLGELSVTKTVQGDLGDQEREWSFAVTLTSPADYVNLLNPAYQYTCTVTDSEGAPVAGKGGVLTFEAVEGAVTANLTLKHGETAVIKGIPVGAAYTVVEAEANTDGYTTTGSNDQGAIEAGETAQVSFVNGRYSESDYNPNTVSVTVNKVWSGDGAAARPAAITAVLYRDGQRYTSVELNEGNNWSNTWSGLSEGYTWTVDEPAVPEGYTSEVTQNGDTFTVTNTYVGPENPENPETPDEPENPENPGTPEEEEIFDEDTPLADLPDDDVPLANIPDEPLEEFEELLDDDVPLADVPETGDESHTPFWGGLCGLSLLGIIALLGKKRKDEKA